jgi:hypothetical protein
VGTVSDVPASVVARIVRYHLLDGVRGEPMAWEPADIQAREMKLTVQDPATGRLLLTGTARMKHGEERGYDCRLQGEITVDRKTGEVSRLDLLGWGEAWGEGPYTRGAPKGKFPLLIAASIAPRNGASRVPPQFSRWYDGYIRADADLR